MDKKKTQKKEKRSLNLTYDDINWKKFWWKQDAETYHFGGPSGIVWDFIEECHDFRQTVYFNIYDKTWYINGKDKSSKNLDEIIQWVQKYVFKQYIKDVIKSMESVLL